MKNNQPPLKVKDKEQSIADKFFDKAWLIVTTALLFATFLYRDQFGGPISDKHEDWGQFGDFFAGILNPLISFLTLLVASKVWQLQKQELRETREAIKSQTLDQFFMGMLSAHRSMVEQVTYLGDQRKVMHTGKRAIDTYSRELRRNKDRLDRIFEGSGANVEPIVSPDSKIYEDVVDDLPDKFPIKFKPTSITAPYICGFCVRYYGRDYSLRNLEIKLPSEFITFEQAFGHIFRSTYQILKLIDEEFGENLKKSQRYVNLLRAQMSESEFIFLALSAITVDGEKSWARAVRLNFFEDRLQNSDWTKDLVRIFEPTDVNLKKANELLKIE